MLSILASISLVRIKWKTILRKSFLILLGFSLVSSLILGLLTWSLHASNPLLKVTEEEMKELVSMSDTLKNNYRNNIITIINPPTYTTFMMRFVAPHNLLGTANEVLFSEVSYLSTLQILNHLSSIFKGVNTTLLVAFNEKYDKKFLQKDVPLIAFLNNENLIYNGQLLKLYELPLVEILTKKFIRQIKEELPQDFSIYDNHKLLSTKYDAVTKFIEVVGKVEFWGKFSRIECRDISLNNTNDVYVQMMSNNPITITARIGKVYLNSSSIEEITIRYNGKTVSLEDTYCEMELPAFGGAILYLSGSSIFHGLATSISAIYNALLPNLNTDVIIYGDTSFSVVSAGTYIYLKDLNLSGTLDRKPPKLAFNYLEEIVIISFFICFLSFIALLMMTVCYNTKVTGNMSKQNLS